MKKYKFGFDLYALLLFSIIVIPNFIWFAIPAKIDILRFPSRTPIISAHAVAVMSAQKHRIICLCFCALNLLYFIDFHLPVSGDASQEPILKFLNFIEKVILVVFYYTLSVV